MFKRILVLSIFAISLFFGVASAMPLVNTLEKSGWSKYQQTGIAIRGYDTVAYFTEGRAIKGNSALSARWNGAEWLFSSEHHRRLFEQDPERYAPQFGGYCAYGVVLGELLKIEGDQWMIHEGKLYLNYSRKWLRKWESDLDKNIEIATLAYANLIE